MPQSDQNAAQSSQSQSSTSTTTKDKTTSTQTSDQDANAANNADTNAKGGKLPQTATPLPLLALLGMGSLTSGIVARFRKK